MPRPGSVMFATIFASLALVTLSCTNSIQSHQSASSQSIDNDGVEDSGKRLIGEFILISSEDPYRHDVAQPQSTFTFDSDGYFKRQDKSRVEEGSYLITTAPELVLYIEKVNGEQHPAARLERYQMADENDTGFTLQDGSSRRSIFHRR